MIARNPELQGGGPYRFVNYSDDKHNGTHNVSVSVTVKGEPKQSECEAPGPIEAGIQAIKSASGTEGCHFEKYLVHSQGKDEGANALVSMEIYKEGRPDQRMKAYACGADTIEASLRCFVNGVNQLENRSTAITMRPPENR
jgi:hypothetical protein